MKTLTLTLAAGLMALAGNAYAQDAAAGEKAFKSCKACHGIVNGDEVIYKGGKTGPNLFGVIGRQAGSYEGFRYSKSLVAAGEAGLVWTEELLAEFIQDPKAFLRKYLDDPKAKSKMTFKARKGAEDIAAFLASVAPPAEGDGADPAGNDG